MNLNGRGHHLLKRSVRGLKSYEVGLVNHGNKCTTGQSRKTKRSRPPGGHRREVTQVCPNWRRFGKRSAGDPDLEPTPQSPGAPDETLVCFVQFMSLLKRKTTGLVATKTTGLVATE
jgi:hypothetical protein